MISSDVFGFIGRSLYLDDKKDKFLRIIVIVTVHCGIPASPLLRTGTSSRKPCFHVHVLFLVELLSRQGNLDNLLSSKFYV